MRKRLLTLGLLAAVTQLFATGCFRIVSRYREHHQFQPFNLHRHDGGRPCSPCDDCGVSAAHRPNAHPIAHHGAHVGPIGTTPCNCDGSPGITVGHPGVPTVIPGGHPPGIGYPIPLTPGPTVVPSQPMPLPAPMPLPEDKGKGTSKLN